MNTRPEIIRSFIALDFSPEAKAELLRVQDLLKQSGADVKWVDPAIAHITLKFLGNVPEEKIPHISDRINDIASGTAPFDVSLNGMGVFPAWRHPEVLWVGIGDDSGSMVKTRGLIEEAMSAEGFRKDARPFLAHVTIGRVRSAKRKDELKSVFEGVRVEPVPTHVSRVILYSSDLSGKAPRHKPLSTLDFNG